MTITQSAVDDHFAMLDARYIADFGKGMVRFGQVGMVGNSIRGVDVMTVPGQPKKVALNAYKEVLER
jgi:hypothetical protein